jgi:NAD(P)-dependent dehydrogenase (short-subunit alcohol dehydrogenase family)
MDPADPTITPADARRLAIAKSTGIERPPGPLDRPSTLASIGPYRLTESVALVTGGGHGIGRDTAFALANAGATVVVADVDQSAAERVAGEIGSEGGTADAFGTDVSDEERVRKLVEHISGRHGRLDIVVNNAGIIHVDRLLDTPLDTWRRVFRVNADGTFIVSRAAVRVMRCQPPHSSLRRRGILVNVSSLASEIPRPSHVAYAASKAAINSLSKTCAAAFAADDVATVVVYPGNVREGMWRHLGASLATLEGRSRAEVEEERFFQPSTQVAEIVRDAVGLPGLTLNGALVLYTREIADI